jgi:hypothetical protein
LHVSAPLQAMPSLHDVPVGAGGLLHAPVAGLQVPVTWHASVATHVTAVPGVHRPAPLHVSAPLQALPSPHDVPGGAGGLLHAPLVVSHVPATWQASEAVHVTGVPAWQTPLALQVSAPLQRLPSLHAVPGGPAGFEHTPVAGLQVPAT